MSEKQDVVQRNSAVKNTSNIWRRRPWHGGGSISGAQFSALTALQSGRYHGNARSVYRLILWSTR